MNTFKVLIVLVVIISCAVPVVLLTADGAHITIFFKNESDRIVSDLKIERVEGGFSESASKVEPGETIMLKGRAGDATAESDFIVDFDGQRTVLEEGRILFRGSPRTVYIDIYLTKQNDLVANRTWRSVQAGIENEK